MRKNLIWVVILGLVWVIGGCAPKHVVPVSEEDNSAHHYLMGMELIDKNDMTQASARFDRSLKLEPKYAPSIAGQALVASLRAQVEQDKGHKSVEVKKALDLLDDAEDEAKGDSQEFAVRVTRIRVYLHATPEKWLNKAKKEYDKALKLRDIRPEELPYYKTRGAADYFMGLAYFKALEFKNAEETLGKVLSTSPGRWHDPANKLYMRVQKITRAAANFTLSDVAKGIAVKEGVVRADVAALLVDEIHLDRFLAGRIPTPEKQSKETFIPADVINNLFKSEILIVTKWGLRGLEPLYDTTSKAYLFYPERSVTRKELAFILEDILMKITGDKSLATKYFGQKNSPYPDVPVSSSSYNAVMNAVTRGLMEPDLSGAFRPDDNADGAELILAVMRLRNVMNVH